jgi:probable rRNA maturation factor
MAARTPRAVAAPAPDPMQDLVVDVLIDSEAWRALPGVEARIEEALMHAAREAGAALLPGAEVSVLLADDTMVRELNRQWRGFDKPTNVLSFPACPPAALASARLIGDIALGYETVAREAAAEARPVLDHVTHLAIHGFLHLIGHDHETPDEGDRMEALETRILAGLGVPDPYGEPAPAAPATSPLTEPGGGGQS